MLLADFLQDRYALEHAVTPGTVYFYRAVVNAFASTLGRPATLADLNSDTVNRCLLAWLRTNKPRTVRGRRGALVTLWKAAKRKKLCSGGWSNLRPIKIPHEIPQAWTLPELQRLVEAAQQLAGRIHRREPAGPVLRALLLVGYYSGLRRGDLLSLRARDVDAVGVLATVQHKTQRGIVCRLPAEALQAVALLRRSPEERLFPIKPRSLFYWWNRLKAVAGIDGSPKWLRRTGATQVEMQAPGGRAAAEHLGHRTPGLAARHYIDWRQIKPDRPLPTELPPPRSA